MSKSVESSAQIYRAKGKELRELAMSMKFPEAGDALMAVAIQYERLADADDQFVSASNVTAANPAAPD